MAVTVGDALRRLGARLDRLDARLLVQHLSGLSHAELIARPETVLSDEQEGWLDLLATRRERGEPLAYLVGRAGFRQLDLVVSPAVLVPRPETEVLVDWALDIGDAADLSHGDSPRSPHRDSLRSKNNERVAAWSVLDLGTGSGAIPLALKHERPAWRVSAVDLSADALKVAQGNAHRLGLAVDFFQSDWYGNLPAALRVDCIVANPPYVADGDPHLAGDGLRFEPKMALTDFADGLSALRRIVEGAPAYLKPGGWLLMEHGYDQAAAVRALLARDFEAIATRCDLAGIERVTGGRRQATPHD